MKKVLILYDSVYGNTKKIAMSLSRGLESGGIYVDVIYIQQFKIKEIDKYDLIAIGGKTHFHGASRQMESFLSKLKHLQLNDKLGIGFETKIHSNFSGSAAKRIMRHLNKLKLHQIYPVVTGIVLDKEGPLKHSTINTMEQIGLGISEKINNMVK